MQGSLVHQTHDSNFYVVTQLRSSRYCQHQVPTNLFQSQVWYLITQILALVDQNIEVILQSSGLPGKANSTIFVSTPMMMTKVDGRFHAPVSTLHPLRQFQKSVALFAGEAQLFLFPTLKSCSYCLPHLDVRDKFVRDQYTLLFFRDKFVRGQQTAVDYSLSAPSYHKLFISIDYFPVKADVNLLYVPLFLQQYLDQSAAKRSYGKIFRKPIAYNVYRQVLCVKAELERWL